MAKGKSVVVVDKFRGGGVSDDRGKTRIWRSREAMDFDPKLTPLRSQGEVINYLARHDVHLSEEIMMAWYPLKANVRMPPWWCVYLSPDLGVGDEASLN